MANELVVSEAELAIVHQAQSVMQTSYDDRVLVNMIAQSIATPKDSKEAVTMADVLTVVRTASSMRLDAVLGGIWAFKDKNGRLVCGVSKKGWQQALHSQPNYSGVEFTHNGELKEKRISVRGQGQTTITYYESITCIIRKTLNDGSIGEFKGTAYFDEEFDPCKETWIKRPKRMLETRALTIAASNAYGWGAYDLDEIQDLAYKNNITEQQGRVIDAKSTRGRDRVALALENTAKEQLIKDMNNCVNYEELVKVFKEADKSLQKDTEIVELAKNLKESLSTVEEL